MKPFTTSVLALAAASTLSAASAYKITGPFVHDNLSIFLIHGQETAPRTLLTLEEAIAEHKVIVYETRDVNELAIENVSGQDVFLESGDIVKGGAQDRTLKDDLILPAKSGRVNISAFCVEHGRWTQRGKEPVGTFDSSTQALASKDLKIAVKMKENQSEVWRQVAQAQARLSMATSLNLRAAPSPTSLPLTVEAPEVQRSIDGYLQDLAGAPNHQTDVIGYAFAINGKLNSADVYGSRELFSKLWMKLLRASAVEAVGEYRAGDKFAAVTILQVRAALADAESAKPAVRNVTARTEVATRETAKNILFETLDHAQNGAWVHRSYMTK